MIKGSVMTVHCKQNWCGAHGRMRKHRGGKESRFLIGYAASE